MKRALALGAVTGLMAFGIAPAAHAGEITGNGRITPILGGVAASACAFSGLEDADGSGSSETPRATQNWGRIPKGVRDQMPPFLHTGSACNPTLPFPGEPS